MNTQQHVMDVSSEEYDNEDDNPSDMKKTKLSDAHPGASFRVLRSVLFTHGRVDFNRELAYWDLPSLYQVAAHDKVLGQALAGNDMALVRFHARQASREPRIAQWKAVEANVVMWLDVRLSPKGKAEGINYRHVAVCAYVTSHACQWAIKWENTGDAMMHGTTTQADVFVNTVPGWEMIGITTFFVVRLLELSEIDSTFGTVESSFWGIRVLGINRRSAWAIILYQAFHSDPALLVLDKKTAANLKENWNKYMNGKTPPGKPRFVIFTPDGLTRPIAACIADE